MCRGDGKVSFDFSRFEPVGHEAEAVAYEPLLLEPRTTAAWALVSYVWSKSSQPTPSRIVAQEQIGALRMPVRTAQDAADAYVMHAGDQGAEQTKLERRAKRLRQRIKDLGPRCACYVRSSGPAGS